MCQTCPTIERISMNAKEGDIVKIGETRKISKTKNFVVMEIITEAKQ